MIGWLIALILAAFIAVEHRDKIQAAYAWMKGKFSKKSE